MSGVEVLVPSKNVVGIEGDHNGAESVDKSECDERSLGGAEVNTCSVSVDNNSTEDVFTDKLEYQPEEKKKKLRRGKSKKQKYKPYFKLSWQERRKRDVRETKRANRVRAEMFAHGQPVAPYNTTQFLMEDNNDVQDLDVQLKSVSTSSDTVPVFQKPCRARDSSFSLDSDEDFFYSSPEDEEEFLTKEFSNTYEDLHAERLSGMTKAELIQEYLQLEDRVDVLEKNLNEADAQAKERADESDEEIGKGEMHMDPETAEKIRIFQQEISNLIEENDQLREENERLQNLHKSDSSSFDSDSDSTSTVSCSTNCNCETSCSDSDSDSGEHSDEMKSSDSNNENMAVVDTVSSTTDIISQRISSENPVTEQMPDSADSLSKDNLCVKDESVDVSLSPNNCVTASSGGVKDLERGDS